MKLFHDDVTDFLSHKNVDVFHGVAHDKIVTSVAIVVKLFLAVSWRASSSRNRFMKMATDAASERISACVVSSADTYDRKHFHEQRISATRDKNVTLCEQNVTLCEQNGMLCQQNGTVSDTRGAISQCELETDERIGERAKRKRFG